MSKINLFRAFRYLEGYTLIVTDSNTRTTAEVNLSPEEARDLLETLTDLTLNDIEDAEDVAAYDAAKADDTGRRVALDDILSNLDDTDKQPGRVWVVVTYDTATPLSAHRTIERAYEEVERRRAGGVNADIVNLELTK